MQAPQEETPTSGCNQLAGANTQNTGAIVAQVPASGNQPTSEPERFALYLERIIQGDPERLLHMGAYFLEFHSPKTLFMRNIKIKGRRFSIRMEWPGSLVVYDADTGKKLAQSVPGEPKTLQKQ